MARTSIGLDIGASGVRAAEIAYTKSPPSLEGFGQVSLPRGAVEEGEIADPGTVSQAISELWKRARLRNKKVAVGVANQKVVVRPIDLPYMEEDELQGALQFQVQEQIPFPVEDAVLDFQILDQFSAESGDRMMRVLLVAALRDMVSGVVNTVQAAGLDPAAVDVVPLALVRALGGSRDSFGEAGNGEAIVDIGAGITNIVIHEAGITKFVRILLTGGNSLSDALAGGLGISFEEAEGVKQRLGLSSTPAEAAASQEAAARILEQRAAAFIDEVRGTLDYYGAQAEATKINRVVLTGGGSKVTNLANRLADSVRVPVEQGRTLSTMQVGKVGLSEDQVMDAEPLMGAAVGLALGESES